MSVKITSISISIGLSLSTPVMLEFIEGLLEALKVVFCVQSAERLFFKELMGIFRNMQREIASQHAADLEQPAELYFGTFNGIEVGFSI